VSSDDYYILDPKAADPKRIKAEREKARKLRKSQWWLDQLNRGICHYCGRKLQANQLTMDHIVPLARGGTSAPGNIVAACRDCNRDKKLHTPVDQIFQQLEAERAARSSDDDGDDHE
jgi:5-methylcytosine-specific restriction endonuclease McrA